MTPWQRALERQRRQTTNQMRARAGLPAWTWQTSLERDRHAPEILGQAD